MKFSEKLQRLRKKQGWTQEELAAKIAVSRQALSKWELGAATPDTENILQISKLFGVLTDYLLNDEFESDDISAVHPPTYTSVIYVVTGSVISVISAAGLLILGILSAIYPAVASYPSTETDGMVIVKTGLSAFLALHNIGWLFAMCLLLFGVGIFIAVYPKLRLYRVKNSVHKV